MTRNITLTLNVREADLLAQALNGTIVRKLNDIAEYTSEGLEGMARTTARSVTENDDLFTRVVAATKERTHNG